MCNSGGGRLRVAHCELFLRRMCEGPLRRSCCDQREGLSSSMQPFQESGSAYIVSGGPLALVGASHPFCPWNTTSVTCHRGVQKKKRRCSRIRATGAFGLSMEWSSVFSPNVERLIDLDFSHGPPCVHVLSMIGNRHDEGDFLPNVDLDMTRTSVRPPPPCTNSCEAVRYQGCICKYRNYIYNVHHISGKET